MPHDIAKLSCVCVAAYIQNFLVSKYRCVPPLISVMWVCQRIMGTNRKSSQWSKLEQFEQENKAVLDYNPVHTDIIN